VHIPKCFGRYGRFMYEEGVKPELCVQCEVAEHCYRATTTEALSSIAADLGLLIDNLLEQGKIEDYGSLGNGGRDGEEDDLDSVIPRN
jgi:hypothetical protein